MNEQNNGISRRKFLATTAAGVALAALPDWFTKDAEAAGGTLSFRSGRKIGPNDQINVGVIGPGGSRGGYRMGLGDARNASHKPGVKIVAVCDVDSVHRKEAAEEFGADCAQYIDFRELLARKDIDAVIIGTPDHWHSYISIAAMKAGKDVYCEKPLTLTIDEGKRLVKAWKDTGAVFQTGSQQRSDDRFRLACELVRNGRIGKITKVTSNLPTGPVGGPFPVEPVPEGFEWDMWQGQTPFVDYVKERTHGSFRWWLEYSGGMLTDWGAHHNDIAQWGLGMDRWGPISIEGIGRGPMVGRNCYSTFPEFDLTATYENGIPLRITNQGSNGVKFEGEAGWILVDRGKIEASDQKLLDEPLPDGAIKLYNSGDHMGNFIECIRTRKQPICDAEIGYRSVSICHLANICLRLGGGKLKWDPKNEVFVDNRAANAMLRREARKPWQV
jgi:predicted dehydrogenase